MAMEGPTPVSALIHAATMVTAGVYLLIRSSPLLEFSSNLLLLIIWLGVVCKALIQGLSILCLELSNSGDILKLLVPNYNLKILCG